MRKAPWVGAAVAALGLLLVAWFVLPGLTAPELRPEAQPAAVAEGQARHPTAEPTAPPTRWPAPGAAATEPLCTLEVLVLTPDDDPVPGVGVAVLADDGLEEGFARLSRVTAHDGLATFDALRAGRYAIRLDRGPSAACELTGRPAHRVTLRLTDGVDLRGIVVDLDERPVAGAGIFLFAATGRSPMRDARTHRAATSDADGRFGLRRVVRGQALQARQDGHAPSPLRFLAALDTDETLRLQLGGEAAVLTGRVSSAGEPLSGARLEFERPRPGMFRENGVVEQEHIGRVFRSDAGGHFALRDLLPGPATVRARAPGHAPGEVNVVLVAGATQDVVLELGPGAALRGVVRDLKGHPIAGAEIASRSGDGVRHATTGPGGGFLLDGLPPGRVAVQARKVGEFCGARHEQELTLGEQADCEIVLWPLTWLRGRVVDAAGRGLPGFVVAPRLARSQRGYVAVRTDERGRTGIPLLSAPTDENGAFEARVMPEEAYILDVRANDQWLDIDGEALGTFVGPREGIVITVQDADRATAFVQGRLVGRDGLPVEGAWFQISDGRHLGTTGHDTPGTERTAADGAFRIGPMPARRYRITVHAESARIANFETDEFELSLHQVLDLGDVRVPGGSALLIVDLRYPDGTPVRDALLQLHDPAAERTAFVLNLDKNGHFEKEVPPGRFELTLYGGRFRWVRETLELAAGEQKRLEYRAEPTINRAIRMTFPPGEESGTLLIRDPEGGLLSEWDITVPAGGQRTFEPMLGLGRHAVEFAGASGARYAGSLEMTSLKPQQTLIDVILARQ